MPEHLDNHDILDENTQKDSIAKFLLTHKQIVAMILREYFPEFKGWPLDFIKDKCLDGLEDTDYLIGDRTHGSAGTDMDVCIHARLPKDLDSQIGIIINIEIQKKFNPGYDIIKRGIYYACSLITMEKETVFAGSDYNGLKKVYSVWICLDAPLKTANQVIRYGMAELCQTDETQGVHEAGAAYDLLEIMMICLNDGCQKSGGPVIDMLRTLFSLALSKERKRKILEEEFSITFKQEEQEMLTVADYIEYVAEKCEERGIKLGEERGIKLGEERAEKRAEDKIKNVVANMLRQGMSEKEIQILLGVSIDEVRKLIHDVQTNAQS